jgi:hypothetical protein
MLAKVDAQRHGVDVHEDRLGAIVMDQLVINPAGKRGVIVAAVGEEHIRRGLRRAHGRYYHPARGRGE